ncbi:hypothetical protein PIGHUM_00578 [Pigmentiphaga humi]|uniref:DUF4175 domain-containing protein n=1 Tax=Pigmentiphaga humi TaxID=2478468 RepID=A0A3P4AWU4_9BURK|nr:hypothetical protein [Pigmentiphaga humi]VCU68524.1 hypothetical protein PIGHUM_00578 [Pigmentiphaga humi]
MRNDASRKSRPGGFWFVWGVPLILAALTAFGLLAALLGMGLWRVGAWMALAAPIGVAAYFAARRPPSR